MEVHLGTGLRSSRSQPTHILAKQIFPTPPELILRDMAMGVDEPSLELWGPCGITKWLGPLSVLLLTAEDELDRLPAEKVYAPALWECG